MPCAGCPERKTCSEGLRCHICCPQPCRAATATRYFTLFRALSNPSVLPCEREVPDTSPCTKTGHFSSVTFLVIPSQSHFSFPTRRMVWS